MNWIYIIVIALMGVGCFKLRKWGKKEGLMKARDLIEFKIGHIDGVLDTIGFRENASAEEIALLEGEKRGLINLMETIEDEYYK